MYRSHVRDPNPTEGTELRYAEIMSIFKFNLGEEEFVLIKGKWFPSIGQELDATTKQPSLRTNLAWDTEEPIMEATNIENQVLVAVSPYDDSRYIVLDRMYDSMVDMLIPTDLS